MKFRKGQLWLYDHPDDFQSEIRVRVVVRIDKVQPYNPGVEEQWITARVLATSLYMDLKYMGKEFKMLFKGEHNGEI
jgi:hypothetical protein